MVARVAVADREMFLRLVSAAAQASGVPEEKVWEPILDQYWRQVRVLCDCLISAG